MVLSATVHLNGAAKSSQSTHSANFSLQRIGGRVSNRQVNIVSVCRFFRLRYVRAKEIPVLQAVLPLLPVAGRGVLADALHTQVVTAQRIVQLQGHSVLTVKKNHPCAGRLAHPLAQRGQDHPKGAA